ncbi:MAG: patatin-like phospholipase family protein [Sphingobacteriales bacterium]|jgi:NTE family protein
MPAQAPADTQAFPDHSAVSIHDGIALALSGGGYRAMVFHVGALLRLNEVGLLEKVARVSSVSGGSITAGALAISWPKLRFQNGSADNLDIVVDLIRKMASTTVDMGAVIGGILLPGTVSDRVVAAYDEVLFKGKKLSDLSEEAANVPRFVFNATNVQTAALWRFSKPYMGDYRVGLIRNPDVPLAIAVAASSAFPPVLSPVTLEIEQPVAATEGADLSHPPYTETAVLSDGGVYDNLGLETVFKRYKILLVSDAGQKIAPEEQPHHDWVRHSMRILDTVDNQVRSLRKRHLIHSYVTGENTGCYWGIRTHFADYHLADDPLGCARRNPDYLAAIPTRLEAVDHTMQNKLMNWGYAVCDAAIRAHMKPAEFGITVGTPKFPFSDQY